MTSFVPRARHNHHSASCFETPNSPASLRKSLKGEDVEPGANNRVHALEKAALLRSTRWYNSGGAPGLHSAFNCLLFSKLRKHQQRNPGEGFEGIKLKNQPSDYSKNRGR